MQKTKQATKTNAKPANKANAKVKTVPFYAALLAACLAGKFNSRVTGYYQTAIKYHAKKQTRFPRHTGETIEQKEAQELIALCSEGRLASGSKRGQVLFDRMIIETYPAGKVTA
jgi:hypothetical protein